MVAGNMLVTFHPNEKGHAETEVRSRLKDVGAYVESIKPTNVDGVIEVSIAGDPRTVVKELRKMCLDDPGLFVYTHHWVPIDEWVEPDVDSMVRVTTEYGKEIGRNDRWMLHLHKRHSGQHSIDLIDRLTKPIDAGIIDLKNPQKIIVVELMGDRSGMSFVKCDEVLDVSKIRTILEIRMR